jgi:hypothetical protein
MKIVGHHIDPVQVVRHADQIQIDDTLRARACPTTNERTNEQSDVPCSSYATVNR